MLSFVSSWKKFYCFSQETTNLIFPLLDSISAAIKLRTHSQSVVLAYMTARQHRETSVLLFLLMFQAELTIARAFCVYDPPLHPSGYLKKTLTASCETILVLCGLWEKHQVAGLRWGFTSLYKQAEKMETSFFEYWMEKCGTLKKQKACKIKLDLCCGKWHLHLFTCWSWVHLVFFQGSQTKRANFHSPRQAAERHPVVKCSNSDLTTFVYVWKLLLPFKNTYKTKQNESFWKMKHA